MHIYMFICIYLWIFSCVFNTATTIIIKIPVNIIALITPTPKKNTCHHKWYHFKRKFHLPTPIINFQGIKICMYINII